jgi:hypothetical protein
MRFSNSLTLEELLDWTQDEYFHEGGEYRVEISQ